MKLKRTDKEIVNNRKCQIKGCLNKAYGIAKAHFLCEMHYREIVPEKERKGWSRFTQSLKIKGLEL